MEGSGAIATLVPWRTTQPLSPSLAHHPYGSTSRGAVFLRVPNRNERT